MLPFTITLLEHNATYYKNNRLRNESFKYEDNSLLRFDIHKRTVGIYESVMQRALLKHTQKGTFKKHRQKASESKAQRDSYTEQTLRG